MTLSSLPLKIKFQTAQVMPPPYAYFYTLQVIPGAEELAVDLQLNYLDRDEIDEETILDEGFTLEDSFAWKGKLPFIWKQEVNRLLDVSTFSRTHSTKETDNYIELITAGATNSEVSHFPENTRKWDYLLQELIQGIYEVAGKERPFELEYREITGRESNQLKARGSFADRTLTLWVNDQAPSTLPWKWSKEVMETVFKPEFLPDEASEQKPSFEGTYLAIGDGIWYEFGASIVEPTSGSKLLPKIKTLMNRLREEAS